MEKTISLKGNVICQPFYDIKGAAFNSYNWYHGGVDEMVYEVGMAWELKQLGYIVHRQEVLDVFYKGVNTGAKRRLDMFVETPELGNIILELKSLGYVDDGPRRQLRSYLRVTNTEYGMLINFGPNGVYTEVWKYVSNVNDFYRVLI